MHYARHILFLLSRKNDAIFIFYFKYLLKEWHKLSASSSPWVHFSITIIINKNVHRLIFDYIFIYFRNKIGKVSNRVQLSFFFLEKKAIGFSWCFPTQCANSLKDSLKNFINVRLYTTKTDNLLRVQYLHEVSKFYYMFNM